MKIDVVFPVLPPTIDGIGDHTALLGAALAELADVRILTAQEEYVPIPGVRVEQGFTADKRSGVLRLIGAVRAREPDWVFLQFNQFSYGRWGLNPFLPAAMRRIKETVPGTRFAWMVHEDYMPPTSLKKAIMSMWQRNQFQRLGNSADVIFFSIEPWVEQYRSWFPDARVEHLPVGSNIPRVVLDRTAVRQELGINRDTLILGHFGTLSAPRLIEPFRKAVAAIRAQVPMSRVLNVGSHGKELTAILGPVVIDRGQLPAREVSKCLSAMDIQVTAFMDGVSTRRGSFMAGLQHGIATITNSGRHTDDTLLAEDGRSMLLSPLGDDEGFVANALRVAADADLRSRLATGGAEMFARNYGWPAIAAKLRETLRSAE